jgi:hypothetical protein
MENLSLFERLQTNIRGRSARLPADNTPEEIAVVSSTAALNIFGMGGAKLTNCSFTIAPGKENKPESSGCLNLTSDDSFLEESLSCN